MSKMNHEEHKERHIKLHASLDELVADFIMHTEKRPSQSTVLELIGWSAKQIHNPEEREDD